MSTNQAPFLIDANSLITPFQSYYPFDWAPNFWQSMENAILSGHVKLLDVVRDEILRGDDELKTWVQHFDDTAIMSRQNHDIINMYSDVLGHIQTCGFYKSNALTEWSYDNVADGWLIAAAGNGGYTVVTFETPNNNLNSRYPSKTAKIPNVCDHFSIRYVTLFDMMRALDFKL